MTSRRRKRRLALGSFLFACLNTTSCGTPGSHDLEVYGYRAGQTEERTYTLADGSEHTVELRGIAHVNTATLAQVVNVMSRVPPAVARSCESITYIAQREFHSENVVGDAHSSLNAGNICLIREPLEDWLVHELAHLYRNGADPRLVERFDRIGAHLYGRNLGPREVAGDKAKRWSDSMTLPCGQYGPALGFVSPYAVNNANECMSEMVEALYCLTYHTPAVCRERAGNPFVRIAEDIASHRLEDHVARVTVAYEMGAIDANMKARFDQVMFQARMQGIAASLVASNR